MEDWKKGLLVGFFTGILHSFMVGAKMGFAPGMAIYVMLTSFLGIFIGGFFKFEFGSSLLIGFGAFLNNLGASSRILKTTMLEYSILQSSGSLYFIASGLLGFIEAGFISMVIYSTLSLFLKDFK